VTDVGDPIDCDNHLVQRILAVGMRIDRRAAAAARLDGRIERLKLARPPQWTQGEEGPARSPYQGHRARSFALIRSK
jgi:hypothetical protein